MTAFSHFNNHILAARTRAIKLGICKLYDPLPVARRVTCCVGIPHEIVARLTWLAVIPPPAAAAIAKTVCPRTQGNKLQALDKLDLDAATAAVLLNNAAAEGLAGASLAARPKARLLHP